MSRYQRVQQLLKQGDNNIEKLSFYPDHLLNLRSILSEWVEKQDWTQVLCLTGESLTTRSRELLQEALSLLQDKLKSGNSNTDGYEFHLRSIETKLKKEYESQPEQFVEQLHHCLTKEEDMLSTLMTQQEQSMYTDNGLVHQQVPVEDMTRRIDYCATMCDTVKSVLDAANKLLEKWTHEVESQNPTAQDVYGNGRLIVAPIRVFQELRRELEQKSRILVQEVGYVLQCLRWYVVQWKRHQLHDCVSRTPEDHVPGLQGEVETMCERVCMCVNDLMLCATSKELQRVDSMVQTLALKPLNSTPTPTPQIPTPAISSWFCVALKDILRKVVEILLVVQDQPPLTMMIEKEKGQKDKEDVNNSKKFKTSVGILGGKGLDPNAVITEVEIYLTFNRDLAEAQRLNKRPENSFRIYHDRPENRGAGHCSSRHVAGHLDAASVPYMKTYEKLRVEQFSRKETKHVYKQLYHVVYNVKLCFPPLMQEYQTQVISLPIIVRTGANQASEHIGAQLWHSFSSPNVYNLRGEIAPTMKASQVIQMINERIRFIGGPGLRDHEKEFLNERLYMVANEKGAKSSGDLNVTLDNFIKDKVMLPRQGAPAGTRDSMDFSLWRWLHSIINLLEDPKTLKQPYIDRIIYGFASRWQCDRALEGKPDGTFLLRFSESYLPGNHIMAKGGLAAVIQINGQADFAPPMTSENIETEGLGAMISNIGCLSLLGLDLTVDDLCQRYPATNPPESSTIDRYYGWRKQEQLVPDNRGPMNSPHQSVDMEPPKREREKKKAKRTGQKSKVKDEVECKMYRVGPPQSPESTISSIPSPLPLGADAQFQAVGVCQIATQQGGYGDTSSQNIPTTVLSHMTQSLSMDPNLMIDASTLPQQPAMGFTNHSSDQFSTPSPNFMDISMSYPQSTTSTFVQNGGQEASDVLVGYMDPSLSTVVSDFDESQEMTIINDLRDIYFGEGSSLPNHL